MTIQTDLEIARDTILASMQKFVDIVHGPATGAGSTVTTDNGDVDTVAKAVAAVGTAPAISAAAALVSENNAATSEGNALTYKNDALAAAVAAAASGLYNSLENKSDIDSPIAPVLADNGVLFVCDTSAGNVVINLPSIAVVGESIRLSVQKTSSLNTITINAFDPDKTNGGTSIIMYGDTEFLTLISNVATPNNWVTGWLSTTQAGAGLDKSGSTINLKPLSTMAIALGDEETPLAAAVGVVSFHAPVGFTLTDVVAGLTTAQTSGTVVTFDINEGGVSILSTKITIDNTEDVSTTAATPPVLSDTVIAAGAKLTIDIDQIGDGTAVGGKIYLVGYPT